MKKLLSLVFALVITLVGIVSVNAATNGSIKITRTEKNYATTYNAYRLFDLSYDETNKSYAYTLNDKWEAFFTTGAGKDYVTVSDITNANGKKYVTLVANADVAKLAKDALKYAKDNNIANDGTTSIAKGVGEATISGLELGYYLVDSSLGALCHISSTDLTANIAEKNKEPKIEKTAQTAVNGTAKIGDEVKYSVTITVADGYEKYLFKDKMTSGLTYKKNAIVKYYNGDTEVSKSGESIDNNAANDYTFKVDFKDVDLTGVTKIVVTYSAIINESAIDNNATQSNAATLTFGDENTTDSTKSTVETKTYNTMFNKVSDKKDATGADIALTGARFKLYDSENGGKEIKVVKVSDGVYRVATQAEIDNNETAQYIEAGSVTIKGLAGTTYYLEETQAPEGFTKLGARVAITADDTTVLPVVNTSGTVLPSTGGFGTTLFIVIGSITILFAGVVLVTKFRLAKQA